MVHADSKATNLIDQRSFYVAVSRAREAATVYTNDRGKLISAIGERAGLAQTALPNAALSAANSGHKALAAGLA